MQAIDKALRLLRRCGSSASVHPVVFRCWPAKKGGGQRLALLGGREILAVDQATIDATSQGRTASPRQTTSRARTAGKTARRPRLFGIAHLSCDEQGRLYWRGEWVDRWSTEILDSEAGRLLAETLALGCLIAEDRGQSVRQAAHQWRAANWANRQRSKGSA